MFPHIVALSSGQQINWNIVCVCVRVSVIVCVCFGIKPKTLEFFLVFPTHQVDTAAFELLSLNAYVAQ